MKTAMKKKDKFFLKYKTGWSYTNINYSGYGYGRHCGGMVNIYGYDPDGNVFDYVVTYRRSLVIRRMLRNGEWWQVDPYIRSNYATNGYNTRCGIQRATKNIDRIKKIARSHELITESGKDAHDMRVLIRS